MTKAIRMLLEQGQITRVQFEQASLLRARHGQTIGYHLVHLGAIGEEELIGFFTSHFSIVHWPLNRIESLDSEIISVLTKELASNLRVLPLERDDNNLKLGICDPCQTHAVEEVARYTGCTVEPVIIRESDMTWALGTYYGILPSPYVRNEQRQTDPGTLLALAESLDDAPDDTPSETQDDSDEAPKRDSEPEPPVDDQSVREENVIAVAEDGWSLDDPIEQISEEENLFSKQIVFSEPPPPYENEEEQQPRELGEIDPIAIESKNNFRGTSIPDGFESDARVSEPLISLQAPVVVGSSGIADLSGTTESSPLQPQQKSTSDKRSSGEVIASIHKSKKRNAIVSLALEYLMSFSERAAFFTVSKTEIRGFEISGDFTSRTAIRAYYVPVSSESTLRQVVIERNIHLGPLGRSPADSILTASLGGRPERVLVIPVEIHDRVVGLLFADKLSVEMPPWNSLRRLGEVVGDNLARLILNRQAK